MATEPTLTDILESVNNAFLIMQENINERFDKIELRLGKIELRLDKIEARLDVMESKFGGLVGILTKNGVISKFEAAHVSALPAASAV